MDKAKAMLWSLNAARIIMSWTIHVVSNHSGEGTLNASTLVSKRNKLKLTPTCISMEFIA